MRAYWTLIRGGNALFAGLVLLTGAQSVLAWHLSAELIWASLVVFCIVAAGNVQNDLCDFEIDRVSKPHRPLVCGKISKRAGITLWIGFLVVASILLVFSGFSALALICFGLLFYYNISLKRKAWIGNVAVAVAASLVPLWGAHLQGSLLSGWYVSVLTGTIILAREFVKTIEDVEGDRAANVRTAAVVAGSDAVRNGAVFSLFALGTICFLPVWSPAIRYPFGLWLCGALAIWIAAQLTRMKSYPSHEMKIVSRRLKLVALAGTVSIWLGCWHG